MQSPLIPSRSAAVPIAVLLVFIAGWLSCHYYEKPRAVPVTAHDQVRQADGSLIAAITDKTQPPQQIVPRGDTVQATGHIVIAASKPVASPDVHVEPAPAANSGELLFADNGDGTYSASPHLMEVCQRLLSCPAVAIDETLVKGKAGQQDLLVSTPGGVVQDATLAPVGTVLLAKAHPWALGVAMPLGLPGSSQYGLAMAYSFQALPVTVGVDVFTVQGRAAGVVEAMVRF
jgi:hypothetical protein